MRWWAGLFVALALAACTSAPPATPAPGPAAEESAVGAPPGRGADRRADLKTLLDRLPQVHPNPYHGVAEAEVRQTADDLAARADGLTDDEFLVGVMRLAALIGSRGLDGHTGAWPWLNDKHVHRMPLRLWEFPDGVYITGSAPAHGDLVGARITAVDGVPIDQVLTRLDPLVPRDNPTSVLAFRPIFFVCTEVLAGLGITRERTAAALTVRRADGSTLTRAVEGVDAATFAATAGGWEWTLPARPGSLTLGHLDKPYHVEYLPAHRAVYLQYNAVSRPGTEIVTALTAAAQGRPVARVVVDLRFNHGGDNTTYRDLVDHLASPTVDRPGGLYLLAGRLTFSAAGNFAGEVSHRAAHERFVGEPTGGAPNQYGDHATIALSRTGLTVQSATTWVEVVPGDTRPAVAPDLPVEYPAAAHFAGRDPVLDAALR